jgi:hypothetical protein
MRKTILLLLFLIIWKINFSQTPFASSYGIGGNPNLSLVCNDNNFFAVSCIGFGTVVAMKTDSIGNPQWSQRFDIANTSFYRLASIEQAVDSGFFILLDIKLQNVTPSYQTVLKLNKFGNLMWTKSYYYSSTNDPNGIIRNNDNGFMITGGGCNGSDYVIKCDQLGNIVWQKQFIPSGAGAAFSIATHDYNRFVVSGYNAYDLIFFEIDVVGNLYWHSIISFANLGIAPFSIKPTADGGFIATGQVVYVSGHTNDAFISKIDSNGIFQWLRVFSVANETIGHDLTETTSGDIIMVGYADYNPDKGLIVKTNSMGNFLFAKCETSMAYNEYFSIHPFSSFEVLLSSEANTFEMAVADTGLSTLCFIAPLTVQRYTPSVTTGFITYTPLNLNFVSTSLTVTVSPNPLVKNILCGFTETTEIPNGSEEAQVFPNPFADELTIALENDQECEVVLYDILSNVIAKQCGTGSVVLNTKNLPKGIYLYQVTRKNGTIVRGKIVKD